MTPTFKLEKDPANGMWVGPDGCHYETEQEVMYHGYVNGCGCGCPEDVHSFICKCLTQFKGKYPTPGVEGIKAVIEKDLDTAAEFIAHFLMDKGLTEHGSSVYGSWLTPLGEQFLAIGPMKNDD
ncbi:hypothetical protein [Mesorhizobium sp. CN2-181]|uniref:hypothetical protein n=1 Tax=Mesorhizobium yinganensis TaxID=3157707 RepID=UPI0032B776FD